MQSDGSIKSGNGIGKHEDMNEEIQNEIDSVIKFLDENKYTFNRVNDLKKIVKENPEFFERYASSSNENSELAVLRVAIKSIINSWKIWNPPQKKIK